MYSPRIAMMMTFAALLGAAPSLASAQAVLVADGGALRRHSGQTQETLLTCVVRTQTQVVVPPYNVVDSERPCDIFGLVADPKTGRWALDITTSPEGYRAHEVWINGQRHSVSVGPDGVARSSGLLVYGDANGVRHVWPGIPASRDRKGRLLFQQVSGFSEDGATLWVALLSSTRAALWSWSLDGAPRGQALKASIRSDFTFVPGSPQVFMSPDGAEARVARLPASGARLKAKASGWRSPVILGDEVFFYVPGATMGKRADGSTRCDPKRLGAYRRLHLKTGEERVWRVQGGCWPADPLFIQPHGASPALFFYEEDQLGATFARSIYRLDRASGAVDKLPLPDQSTALAASADAAQLLIAGDHGVGLWDVEGARYLWQTRAHKITARAAFTLGEPPRGAALAQTAEADTGADTDAYTDADALLY